MADKTKIQWTDATWNPIRARHRVTGRVGWHCTKPSAGCKNCYAEALNKRLGTKLPFQAKHQDDIELYLDEKTLAQPLRWSRPRSIFPCSMTDMFGEFVPDEWLDQMFAVMALCPRHIFQPLTKRSGRMREYLNELSHGPADHLFDVVLDLGFDGDTACAAANWINGWSHWRGMPDDGNPLDGSQPRWPLPNVHLGVSVENQPNADLRIPDLLATPAAKRVVSYEPALGPVDSTPWLTPVGAPGHCVDIDGEWWHEPGSCSNCRPALDQIIVGGESGRGAREFHLSWAAGVLAQCSGTGTKAFIKQLGSNPLSAATSRPLALKDSKGGDWDEWAPYLRVREMLA